MDSPDITANYAALFGLLYGLLSVRALGQRRKLGVALGDAGNPVLQRALRVHANFAEYVPLCLLLLVLVELQGAPAAGLHAGCSGLLLGRLLHAWGLSQVQETYFFRVSGMALTLTVLNGAAGVLLWQAWAGG